MNKFREQVCNDGFGQRWLLLIILLADRSNRGHGQTVY